MTGERGKRECRFDSTGDDIQSSAEVRSEIAVRPIQRVPTCRVQMLSYLAGDDACNANVRSGSCGQLRVDVVVSDGACRVRPFNGEGWTATERYEWRVPWTGDAVSP